MAMLKIYSLEDYAKLVADNWEVMPPTDEDLKREDASETGIFSETVSCNFFYVLSTVFFVHKLDIQFSEI